LLASPRGPRDKTHMGSSPPQADSPRADTILAAAIAFVLLLVLGLVIVLRAEPAAHERTMASITAARAIRDHALALAQAVADAEAARSDVMVRAADAVESHTQAERGLRESMSALRRVSAGDPELSIIVTRIDAIIEDGLLRLPNAQRPAPTSGVVLSQLRAANADLIAVVNSRNDAARSAENAIRQRLNTISIALAALSVLASALAILALRREREQWRLAHETAQESRAHAVESDAFKLRFLTAASHDMRQPLHALTLYLSALNRRVQGEEAHDILAKAERATRSLAGMFSVLFDLARIEAGVLVPEFESVAVQEIFTRAVGEHPGSGVTVTPTDLHVRSDPVMLERLVLNLTSNALKHGGGKASLSARAINGDVEIMVTDEGPGIARCDQERIFDEFVRLGGRESSDGLGLGLSIVRRLASRLNHRLRVQSTPGEGAMFSVFAQRAHAVSQAAPLPTLVTLEGADVLALDDDALALNAISRVLGDLGARVRACASISELEAALATGYAPRFAVLDLRIDGELIGLEVTERLRASLRPPERIVIITADTATEALAALRDSGHAWLTKPVVPAQLVEALSSVANLKFA